MSQVDEKIRKEAIEKLEQADGFIVMTVKGREFKCLGDGAQPAALIALAINNEPGLFDEILSKMSQLDFFYQKKE